MLAVEEDLIPMAGGTDLLVHWPEHLEARERGYLDLSGVESLRGMEWSDAFLTLGALTTYWEVVTDARVGREFRLMVEAARQVGAIQIQSRGTWAGNIANGSPAADGVPVLMAYGAEVELASAGGGARWVAMDSYYTDYKQSVKRPDELITRVRVPRAEYEIEVWEKVGSRRAQAISKVGLAITKGDEGWRVVAASMAPTIRRCAAIEKLLTKEAAINRPEDLLKAIGKDVSPIDDLRSTAAYRELTMARVVYHALKGRVSFVT